MTDLSEIRSLAIPDESALSSGASAAVRMAEAFTIENDDDFAMAAEELRAIKAKGKQLEEKRVSLVEPLNKVVKAINDLFRGPIGALTSAEGTFKSRMVEYSTQKERKAAEERRAAQAAVEAEQRRLREQAEQIEAEARARQRVADEEAARVAAAARAEAERLQREGDEAAAAKVREKAEAARAEAARVAEQEAQTTNAQIAAVQATAAVITAPAFDTRAPTVKGISTAKSVDFEVTDLLALVKHIAAHPELLSLVRADDVKLRAYTRGLGMACALPGVRVSEKSTLSARAA